MDRSIKAQILSAKTTEVGWRELSPRTSKAQREGLLGGQMCMGNCSGGRGYGEGLRWAWSRGTGQGCWWACSWGAGLLVGVVMGSRAMEGMTTGKSLVGVTTGPGCGGRGHGTEL